MTDAASPSVQPWLLALDADAIQAYVYESARLPEISGASQLLIHVGDEAKAEVERQGGKVCYEAGGSLLARVELTKNAMVDLCAALERLYLTRTKVATATAAHLPCRAVTGAAFIEDRRKLAGMLRSAKFAKTAYPFYQATPLEQRCESCDVRPANTTRSWADATLTLCEACDFKWQPAPARDYLHDFARARNLDRVEMPGELTEIAGDGLIGLILMDGDGIGSKTLKMDWDELNEFSSALEKAMKAAVSEGLIAHIHEPLPDGKWPLRVLYIGGDDLMLIVPASCALQVARTIQTSFAGQPQMSECTLSGGIVLSHPHYPTYYLHQLARELCRSAKQYRKSVSIEEGCLDFEVLKSSTSAAMDLDQLRAMHETAWDGSLYRLHDRPYAGHDLDGVLDQLGRLGGESKGALLRLQESMRGGPLTGAAYLLYEAAQKDGALPEVLRELSGGPDDLPGWRRRLAFAGGPEVRASRVGDLVDLFGVTHSQGGNE